MVRIAGAGRAPPMALATSAFQVGIAAGTSIGGLALTLVLNLKGPTLAGADLALAALLLGLLAASQRTTDRDGTAHGLSLPPGLIAPQVNAELLDRARTSLPEPLRLLVEHTREPFAQAILDGRVSRMRKDRMLLTGDAAFVVRPHTAASAEKAAADAITLCTALQQLPSPDAALAAWEKNRLAEGTALYRHGVGLGQQLGLNGPTPTKVAAVGPTR
ncbi:FAD-dependent monooxygenase [Streptomyces sp. NPDC001410]|uniref:FAD binding domain-containing protein n=1 Tax=Streptomyces sp. NPDC001410 TaxID=3364574 RepID=UPI0036CF9F31